MEAGSSQYLTAVDSASLSITGNLTIELWVKFESLPAPASAMAFVSKFPGAADRSFLFSLENFAGTYKLVISISSDGTSTTEKTVNWTPSLATWYHVALVYTAAGGTADFYVDGAAQGSQQSGLPTSIYDSSAAVEVGSSNTGAIRFFDGLIDDVRIWAATRTQAQIDNNRRIEIDGGTSGLNAYWKLNNALTDSTANNNTLTNPNSAVFSTDVPSWGQASDTAGTPTESGGYTGGVKAAFVADKTDTAGAPTEDSDIDYGWANTSKSSAPTWTNLDKS